MLARGPRRRPPSNRRRPSARSRRPGTSDAAFLRGAARRPAHAASNKHEVYMQESLGIPRITLSHGGGNYSTAAVLQERRGVSGADCNGARMTGRSAVLQPHILAVQQACSRGRLAGRWWLLRMRHAAGASLVMLISTIWWIVPPRLLVRLLDM